MILIIYLFFIYNNNILQGGSVQVVNLVDQFQQQAQKSDAEAWRVFRYKCDHEDMLIILTAINTLQRNKSEFDGIYYH